MLHAEHSCTHMAAQQRRRPNIKLQAQHWCKRVLHSSAVASHQSTAVFAAGVFPPAECKCIKPTRHCTRPSQPAVAIHETVGLPRTCHHRPVHARRPSRPQQHSKPLKLMYVSAGVHVSGETSHAKLWPCTPLWPKVAPPRSYATHAHSQLPQRPKPASLHGCACLCKAAAANLVKLHAHAKLDRATAGGKACSERKSPKPAQTTHEPTLNSYVRGALAPMPAVSVQTKCCNEALHTRQARAQQPMFPMFNCLGAGRHIKDIYHTHLVRTDVPWVVCKRIACIHTCRNKAAIRHSRGIWVHHIHTMQVESGHTAHQPLSALELIEKQAQ